VNVESEAMIPGNSAHPPGVNTVELLRPQMWSVSHFPRVPELKDHNPTVSLSKARAIASLFGAACRQSTLFEKA
jgi:hypothetical protein